MTRLVLTLLVLLTLPGLAQDGKKLYIRHCQTCHGAQGKGDGPAAGNYKPPPANFSAPRHGASDEAFLKAISEGIPGTGMTGFKGKLTEAEQKAVLEYLKPMRTP